MGYNYKIDIQQSTESRGASGSVVTTWATYKKVWAERDDTGGALSYESDQPVYSDAMVFKIRSYDAPDVTTKMRVSYNSQTFMVRSIRKEGRFHLYLITEAYNDE